MLFWGAILGSIACSLPFVYAMVTKQELRSLALRNAVRQRGQTVLVIAGIVIATAVATSAVMVGDSLRSSVRRSAVTQLGPVDEEVLATSVDSGRAVEAAVDGASMGVGVTTLPLLSLSTTVIGRDFIARLAPVQVLEVDFARAARFGGDAAATGISGATPSGNRAVMGADLASWLSLTPGHRVRVDAYGTSRTFAIDRVLPRRGIAGLAPVAQTTGSLSLNLFVPLGTIASMLAEGSQITGHAQPVSVLAVSNGPRRGYSSRQSELVSGRLRAATAGLDAQVQPVKQLVLDDSRSRSSRFTRLFSSFGFFSVIGGLLLLVLTFSMLTRDRARSMGILRANGLRRSGYAVALSLEGWLYSIAGAVVGGAVGFGISELVVRLARTVFASQTGGRVDLVFAARSSSLALGCAIGLIASLVVVVSAAFVASRRNIVRMVKGQADPPRELSGAARRQLGGALAAFGIVALGAGLVASNGVASVVASVFGPAVGAVGVVLLTSAPGRTRAMISFAAIAVFVWSVLAITVLDDAFTGLGVTVLASEGLVLTACAVALVSVNHAALTRRWSEPRRRRGLALSLGLAYSRTAPRRTLLIVGMYAVAIFTLTLLVTIGQLYNHNVDAIARDLGGAAALEVSSDATRPVPIRDVAQLPGVTRVTPTSAIDAQLRDRSSSTPVPVTVVGFTDSLAGHGSPPVVDSTDHSIFGTVADDPTKVIVGADVHAERQSGLPGNTLRIGDVVVLRDPLTGATRSLTVAGLVDQGRWSGTNHVFVSRAVVDALSGGSAPENLLYVETAPGTNNDVVAAVVNGTHLRNGAYARSFHTLASDTLSTQSQFLELGAGYAAVGLLADLAGIGVLMVDRIRERRRQIAMLRALGVAGRTVRRAFRVESAVIASEGIVIGVGTGLVLAWRLGSSGGLGPHLAFSPPLPTLLAIGGAVVVASLVATSVPARRAGHLLPAPGLRRVE